MTQPPCLKNALAGDRQALGELMAWCHPAAVRYLQRLCGSHETACDLAQDVMVRVLESLDTYRPRPGAGFLPWVLRIARNRFIDTARAARPVSPLEDAEELGTAFDETAGAALAGIDAEALRAALRSMSQADRELIELRYWFGLSHREAAEVLGVRPQVVKSRLNAALTRLRKQYAADGKGTRNERQITEN